MSLPAITKHIKVLEKAGLVTKSREAQYRPCKLNKEAFQDVADWMEEYRVYWEASFDRLGDYLKTVTKKKETKGKKNVQKNNSNELKITRVYEAPVSAVWDAWTDPEQVAKWWGPRGFTLTTHSKDLRVGGHWHYTMHGPDGTDYPNRTIYHEVEEGKRLVYDHGGYEDRPPLFRVTVVFKSLGDKTKMEMTMAFPTPEDADQSKKFIKKAGGNGTWDRLAEYLEKTSSGQDIFVINRSFEAPLETVFSMWSDEKQLSPWLSHQELVIQSLSDEAADLKTLSGQIARADRARSVHVLFAVEEGGQTRVTLMCRPLEASSPEELKAFVQEKPSMAQEWTESFDRLEIYMTGK